MLSLGQSRSPLSANRLQPERNRLIAIGKGLAAVCLIMAIFFAWQGLYPVPASAFTQVMMSAEPTSIQTSPTREGGEIVRGIFEAGVENQFSVFNLFIILFVTLGPLKLIPPFVQLTQNASRSLKRQLAFRSSAVATVVILLVVSLGRNLLRVWNIQLPAVAIAGGILLFLVSLQTVLSQYGSPQAQMPSTESPSLRMAISPIAFPNILPPFGIAIALTLTIIVIELGISSWVVVLLLLGVMAINLLSMLLAEPIFKFIRPVTLKILGFTLGVMQLALGIQFILTGLMLQAGVIKLWLQAL